jgi:alpha-aminoadipate carrier protein LysW
MYGIWILDPLRDGFAYYNYNGIFEGFNCLGRRAGATMSDCVECGAAVSLHADLEVAEIVDCTTCGAELEVVDVSPPVLEKAPELEEDWGE